MFVLSLILFSSIWDNYVQCNVRQPERSCKHCFAEQIFDIGFRVVGPFLFDGVAAPAGLIDLCLVIFLARTPSMSVARAPVERIRLDVASFWIDVG